MTIIGYSDLPSRLPTQASQLYGTNLRHLLTDMTPQKDGRLIVDMEDDVIRGTTVIHQGALTWPAPAPKVRAIAKPAPQAQAAPLQKQADPKRKAVITLLTMLIGGLALLGLGSVAPADFMAHFTVFVLACFVGYQVIWNVTPALHTPLMTVTNAISGIIVIGALLQVSNSSWIVVVLAAISILIATINITGGFLVTQRMLRMFRKD